MNQKPESVRAALPQEVQREVVEQWAERLGWALVYASERSGSELRGRTFRVGAGTELSFFEDHLLGTYFVHATGPQAQAAMAALREVVALREVDEVLEDAARATDAAAKIASLGPLSRALDPEEPHARALALFEARLADGNASVRRATLVALGILSWSAIDPLLERFEADPVLGPGVRLRRWAKVRADEGGAVDFETKNVGVLLTRATAAVEAGAHARAQVAVDRLLSLSVVREQAYALRARIRRAEGRTLLAYADALTAVSLGRRHGLDVTYVMALAEALAGELKPADAEARAVAKGQTAGGEDEDVTANLATLLGAGRRDEVEEIAAGLLRVPSGQEARIRLCSALAAYESARESARNNRPEASISALRRAVTQDASWGEKARKDATFQELLQDPEFKRVTGAKKKRG
jgi:hypothetical protein